MTAIFGAGSTKQGGSPVKFLGYGGSFVWGSAVGQLAIFRVAAPVLCEGKADGERGVWGYSCVTLGRPHLHSCAMGRVFYCHLYCTMPGCRYIIEQRLGIYAQLCLLVGLASFLQK